MTTPTAKQLHQFILDCFSEDELDLLCLEYFGDALNSFGSGMSRSKKAVELVTYCQRRQVTDSLLAALEKERPKVYRETFGAQLGKPVVPPIARLEAVPTPLDAPTPPRNPKQIFVSHSSMDAELAHRIADDLQAHGYDIFITPESIRPGEKWVPAIGRGLEESGIFLVLLTPHAVESGWVKDEMDSAITLAHENEMRLFLLDVQECHPPILWRQRQFLPFRGEDYRRNLGNLLRELQEEGSSPLPKEMSDPQPEPPPEIMLEPPIDKEKQQHEAQAAARYQQLLQAQESDDWLSVLELAIQIEMLLPEYCDVEAFKVVAEHQLRKPAAKLASASTAKTQTEQPPEIETTAKKTQNPETKAKQPRSSQPKTTNRQPKPTRQLEPVGNTFIHEKTGLEFVRIPEGEFIYSNVKTQKEVRKEVKERVGFFKTEVRYETEVEEVFSEGKLHLPEFWISKTLVTQAVYQRFITANRKQDIPIVADTDADEELAEMVYLAKHGEKRTYPYNWDAKKRTYPADKADHPVVLVNWYDAVAFCEWAGLQLPTEEQWEKAARGIDGRTYPWGNNEPTDKLCNFNNNVRGTTAVGRYSPKGDSPYGCVDVSGNVWEWCLNNYEKPEDTAIDQSNARRVLRGGSWLSNADDVRAAYRGYDRPGYRGDNFGFRVVVVRPPSQ